MPDLSYISVLLVHLLCVTAQIIERDVCIIGGGSSGTHAAVQLQLKGKSVVLIERDARLGGHTNTYLDPVTGKKVDYGVVVFNNVSAVRSYLGHLDIPLAPLPDGAFSATRTANFRTGKEIKDAPEFTAAQIGDALIRYSTLLSTQYPGLSQEWNITYPVQEELLISFGDFLEKHNLTALAPIAYSYNQGAGNVLAQPTIFMLKYLEQDQVQSTLKGFVVNGLGDNQLIYNRARSELGKDNVYVDTYPSYVQRYADHVDVQVISPSGPFTIRAKKLLVSIQPSTSSLDFLDLDSNERSIFGQFNNSYYYDAIVRNTGIPDNTSVNNADINAPYRIPGMPGTYSVSSNGIPNLKSVWFGSSHYMTNADVKKQILAEIARVREGLGYLAPQNKTEFAAFNAHVPFIATVSKQAVKNKFYVKLQALQGKKNTFYTGAAWNVQASSNLWGFNNDIIVPKIMSSLGN